jgi:hypothetical protein
LLILSLVSLLMAFVYLGSFLRQAVAVWRRRGWRWSTDDPDGMRIRFLAVLIVIPLLLFMLTGHNYATRYTILILPLLYMLPALFLQRLQSPRTRAVWQLAIGLILLAGIWLSVAFFSYQGRMIATGDTFLPSFRKLESVYQQLRQAAGAGHRIVLQTDPAIDRLEPLPRKLILALPHYLRLVQTYREDFPDDAPRRVYRLQLASSAEGVSERPVYRRHNLLIVEP